ncbi:MAG: AAA family ATPase, partial [Prevotellaceae bacterium]|nr:AAA family ATPase [Prevotellaceae bacterium]
MTLTQFDTIAPPNYIDLIGAELAKGNQLAASVPEMIGMFSVKTANRTIREAAMRPNPNVLWKTLWYEGEACFLFSDSNLGKSILATQIGAMIAERQKVLLFDFELSDKQFQLRYTGENGELHQFPENFYRVEINSESLNTANFEDSVIENIETAALQTGAKVLIVDNLTYLCIAAEKGDAAGLLMMRLTALKKKYGLSLLVLAHTPKRPLSNPITQNDLAGSKKLYNFFDSGFAIGRSARDGGLRYIKQLKCRHGEFTYDGENVLLFSIEKDGTFLHFEQRGFVTEKEHLKEQDGTEVGQTLSQVETLVGQKKTIREIANELNISRSKAGRMVKNLSLSHVGQSGTSGTMGQMGQWDKWDKTQKN